MVPTRTQIIQVLTNGHEEKEDEILQEIDELIKGLRENIMALQIFYDLNNLNNHNQV